MTDKPGEGYKVGWMVPLCAAGWLGRTGQRDVTVAQLHDRLLLSVVTCPQGPETPKEVSEEFAGHASSLCFVLFGRHVSPLSLFTLGIGSGRRSWVVPLSLAALLTALVFCISKEKGVFLS